MGVQLNIKDPETVRLAHELAKRRGKSVTQAIRSAIEHDLAVDVDELAERKRRAGELISGLRSRFKPEFAAQELSITYKSLLYDEKGLPK